MLLLSFLIILTASKGQNSLIDKTVVKELDIEKYLGKWYEKRVE